MDLAEQQIAPGENLGPYVVSRRLGAGGMGEVYLARHRHLDRDAAVKVLLPEISLNQTVVSRFFTEARATAQLRHPNIVEILDCDVLPDGRAYIVMEYLRGESLRQTLDRVGRLAPGWSSIAAIAGMVADALHAAHETGIVHRDLKPDNTYLTAQKSQRAELTVKVLDFGVAKLLSGGGPSRTSSTRTGSLVGTPLYMSPEQCRGIPNIDHRADIYSLGCMLFEMVVGQPPFVSEAPGDILMAHMAHQPPSLTVFDPNVPAVVDRLVARMLAKDVDQRPQSMAEVVAAFEAFLGMPKLDFPTALRPPSGFPEPVSPTATQILPTGSSTPIHATPFRQTPSPPRQATPVASGPSTEIEPLEEPPPSRPHRTPVSRSRRAPIPHAEREAPVVSDGRSAPRPAWLLPLAILVPLVVLGILGAYWLSRPKHVPPAPEPEHATRPEPAAEPEPVVKPARFVPPTPPPPARAEPEASALARPRPTPVAAPERPAELKARRRGASSAAKHAEPASGSVFKAVGD
jgi:serine/threonine protein kinase